MTISSPADNGSRFEALGLGRRLVDVLDALGYEEPTPIQREAIPPLLEGKDLVGQAATGTGKTAAFALPLLQHLSERKGERARPSALVLVPTRELAMQVSEAVHRYGKRVGTSVLPIYGGQSYQQQLRALRRGVDVVVATPGRALDHYRRGTLELERIEVVVLDEADEMLDMGFAEDLETILAATPEGRQTVLFSATMPARIAAIAKRHLRDPVQIRIAREAVPAGAVPKVRQTAYIVGKAHKQAALGRVLDVESPEAAIVFCRTRNDVDELSETLNAHGYRAEAIHGGMSQDERERVMRKLRSGAADLLIATDVAARGLDIPQLTHVINYDVPSAPESYVHRIGRVGRAGREGVAITLAEPREHRMLRNIERLTKRKIEVARLPTVADLRARRLELTRASIEEVLRGDDLEPYRVIVDTLSDEFDPVEIAMAAAKLAQEATAPETEAREIPEAPVSRHGTGRVERGPRGRKGEWPGAGRRDRRTATRGRSRRRGTENGIVRLEIDAGRNAGIRPQDLVGAITGEAGIAGGEIGAIDIADRYSVVEVAEDVADEVVAALRGSSVKGKRVRVRRERSR